MVAIPRISHMPVDSDDYETIVASRIVRFRKKPNTEGEVTLIFLDDGSIVESKDSLRTLEARLHEPEM